MIHTSFSFVFWGTDEFSVTVLEELKNAWFLPALIVTSPDRPKGRGLALTPPPAKQWALQNGIEFLQPERLDSGFYSTLNPSSRAELATGHGAKPQYQSEARYGARRYTLFVVASYGLIIPKAVLDIPERGALNVHPSLLPKYRGATPIESQILNAEKEVGATIILMDDKMDHGPIVSQRSLRVEEIATPPTSSQGVLGVGVNATKLQKQLAEEGGRLLVEVLPKWVKGEIAPAPQNEAQATYTKKFVKADGELDLAKDPYKNFLKIQAFAGSIGTFFVAEKAGKKIRVNVKDAKWKDGKLVLARVVPEGRKEMSYEEFLRGFRKKR